MTLFYVAIGGFFGAILRYAISTWNKKAFPFGTFFVNVIGSFLLGVINGLHMSDPWLFILGAGFLGAFTTFSTFHHELLKLFYKNFKKGVFYLTSTYISGISLAFLGFLVGKMLTYVS